MASAARSCWTLSAPTSMRSDAMRAVFNFFAVACMAIGFVATLMVAGYAYYYYQYVPECFTARALFTKECK